MNFNACRRFVPWLALLGLGAALMVARAQEDQRRAALRQDCPQQSRIEDQAQFAEFEIRSYRGENLGGCIQVLRNNVVSFSRQTGGKFVLTNGFERQALLAPAIPAGTDVTGLGKPNVVVGEWSGGAHCCFAFHVLELGERIREVAVIDVQDSADSYFVDLDHDGVFELLARDFTFAYWQTSFAESPAPQIVLRFNGSGYDLAPDLMWRPAPGTAELDKLVSTIRAAWQSEYPEPLLWRTMLDLIYTGHPDLAWKVVSEAWRPGRVASKEFLRGFCGQLANSPYFGKLRPTLTDAPCTFDPKNGKRM